MELRSGGNHFHFIQAMKSGSVVKTLNVFKGRPGLVFKKVCDIYGSEDGTVLHPSPFLQPKEEDGFIGSVQARAKADNPSVPTVERKTIDAYSEPSGFSCPGDVDNNDAGSERDSDLDEFGLGNMTLNQLKERWIKKRKRSQHSINIKIEDGVCSPEKGTSTFLVRDEESDLDGPLINWNSKLKKNIQGKKKSPKKCSGTSREAVLPDDNPEESKNSQLFEQTIELFLQPIAVTTESDLVVSPITNKTASDSSHENFGSEVFRQAIECCADVHVPSDKEFKYCVVNEVPHGDLEHTIFPSDVDMTVLDTDNLEQPCCLSANVPESGMNEERSDTNFPVANGPPETPSEDSSCEESGQASQCYDDAQIPSNKEFQWCLANKVPHEELENAIIWSDLDVAVLDADSVEMPCLLSSNYLISGLHGEGCDTKSHDVIVSSDSSNENFSLETSDNCENDPFVQETTLGGCDTESSDAIVSPETFNEDFSSETSNNCENDPFVQDTTPGGCDTKSSDAIVPPEASNKDFRLETSDSCENDPFVQETTLGGCDTKSSDAIVSPETSNEDFCLETSGNYENDPFVQETTLGVCDTKSFNAIVSPETSNEDFTLEKSDNCENDPFVQGTALEAPARLDDLRPMEQTHEVLEGTVNDDNDEGSQIYQETGTIACPINDRATLDDTSCLSSDTELSNGNDTPAAMGEMTLTSANVNEDQNFFSGIHPPRSAEELTKTEGAESHRDSNLHLASGRVFCARKVISPTSQERLRKLMGYRELSDGKQKDKQIEMDMGKNEESNQIRRTSTKVVCRRSKNDRKGLPPQSISKAPQMANSRLRVNSMQSCPKNAIAFSQRQMQDIDGLATKLMTELTSMRDIVEQTIISGANLTASMKYSTDEMKAAVENAIRVEETAKKWVSMMSRDCNRFCKILRLSEDGEPIADNVINKERKKIIFADEAGGKLCHVRYIEENTASPSCTNDEKQELLIN